MKRIILGGLLAGIAATSGNVLAAAKRLWTRAEPHAEQGYPHGSTRARYLHGYKVFASLIPNPTPDTPGTSASTRR